jgi:hypothetical protein
MEARERGRFPLPPRWSQGARFSLLSETTKNNPKYGKNTFSKSRAVMWIQGKPWIIPTFSLIVPRPSWEKGPQWGAGGSREEAMVENAGRPR